MKAVILAGGLGTRLSEETEIRPKPMVEIGEKPILWHIMKIYSASGINDFIVCLGYKGYMIKEYFANYFLHSSDITFDIAGNKMEVHGRNAEPWRVTLVNTGDKTMTGGRLYRIKPFLDNSDFCFTYGDGLSDINIKESIKYHKMEKSLATMTVVQPPGRFGAISLRGNKPISFQEKPQADGGWINAGFFVLSPEVLNYIEGENCVWEGAPLEKLAQEGKLSAFFHNGFWQPMDTLRENKLLEELWNSGNAPWKVWE
jgi:glucose-1-phosphate cytidylyltransferase